MTKQEELTIKEAIIFYLIHNQQDMVKRLQPLKKQRDSFFQSEDKVFHDDIKNDFQIAVKKEVGNELAEQLQLNPEDVMIIMQEFNVKEFLGE